MCDAQGSSHGRIISQPVLFPFLWVLMSMSAGVATQDNNHKNESRPTFNRPAVSGSIIVRTSFTSWLTLEPTCPAPARMTILFGDLLSPAVPFFVLALAF